MTEEWVTPAWLFDYANTKHHFNVDAAASGQNAKTRMFWNKKKDGLTMDWGGLRVWCNPPYGRELEDWVPKILHERFYTKVICLLAPANTETRWWMDLCVNANMVQFIRGRVHFADSNGKSGRARFASALWTLGPDVRRPAEIGIPIEVPKTPK